MTLRPFTHPPLHHWFKPPSLFPKSSLFFKTTLSTVATLLYLSFPAPLVLAWSSEGIVTYKILRPLGSSFSSFLFSLVLPKNTHIFQALELHPQKLNSWHLFLSAFRLLLPLVLRLFSCACFSAVGIGHSLTSSIIETLSVRLLSLATAIFWQPPLDIQLLFSTQSIRA